MAGRVKVWDAHTGALLHTLEGPEEGVTWLQWHPRGSVVLAGSEDFTTWMWNADSAACMQAPPPPTHTHTHTHTPTPRRAAQCLLGVCRMRLPARRAPTLMPYMQVCSCMHTGAWRCTMCSESFKCSDLPSQADFCCNPRTRPLVVLLGLLST